MKYATCADETLVTLTRYANACVRTHTYFDINMTPHPVLFRQQAAPGKIRCLVISPTRELATQIAVEGKTLAQPHGFKIQTVMGGKFVCVYDCTLMTYR